MTRAKVVRVGNDWQVLVKPYGRRAYRMRNLSDFMKWDCRYNSKEFVEETLERVWDVEIVRQFR